MKVAWRKLEGVPVVTVYKGSLEAAADRGCILFFHGLGASKDVQLPDLKSLAARGFLVIGIDGVGHGERRYPDFARRLSQANPEFERDFLTVVLKTPEEVPLLIDNLTHAGFIRDGRIGVAGISLGGFITYTAVTLEPRLRAAVAIVGSPEWTLDLPESPYRHLERFDHIRLLSLTAGKDAVVPSHYARGFHRRLERVYNDPGALRLRRVSRIRITCWRPTGTASGRVPWRGLKSSWFDPQLEHLLNRMDCNKKALR